MHHQQLGWQQVAAAVCMEDSDWSPNGCQLLQCKAITRQFLVQDPLCDTSHLATGSNHSPTGWEICISYSPGGCQEVTDWSPGLKLFVLLTAQLYLSTPLISSLLNIKVWIQFLFSNLIVIKLRLLLWLWKVPDLCLDADSCSRLLCSKSSSVGVTLDLLLIRLISKSAFYQLKNISRLPPTSPPASNTAIVSAFQSPVQSPVCSAVTLTIHQRYSYASSCLLVKFSIYKTLNLAQLLLTNAENKPSLKLT